MPHPDDIAFQRAILANPADRALKLVYADWLQERDDPRADFVRLQLQINEMAEPGLAADAAEGLIKLGSKLDPVWVGFMTTLAQPFEPYTFPLGKNRFTESIGLRGRVAVFESQYHTAAEQDDGLGLDLAFLTQFDWGECAFARNHCDRDGFLCELPDAKDPLTARKVVSAIKGADFHCSDVTDLDSIESPYPGYYPINANDEIHTNFPAQYLFAFGTEGTAEHGELKKYVVGGRLWYVVLRGSRKLFSSATLLAVGRSPHGNRLVGVIASDADINA